jgi:hypothetical protein
VPPWACDPSPLALCFDPERTKIHH